MSHNMRQVSKEEFEVLTRFHPGEVRYYVNMDQVVARKRGGEQIVKLNSGKRRFTSRIGTNNPVQLGLASSTFRDGTKAAKMWVVVRTAFEDDPTKVIGRTELVKRVAKDTAFIPANVGPFVSDCLKAGYLRYTGS